MHDGLLQPGLTLMDYGCGRGGDVARLGAAGYDCSGWDPVHAPGGDRRPASVVNLGYVVNVIEDPAERVETLRRAWSLTRDVLVVSARLVDERPTRTTPELGDGVLTRLRTFQKFFEQHELRSWIDASLEEHSVAAAPGVFYVFRSVEARTRFSAGRFRRRDLVPPMRETERLVAQHGVLLDALSAFLADRGRMPEAGELPEERGIIDALGSMRRAQRLLLASTGASDWEKVREARSEDLLLYLALSRFDGRPRMGELPLDMQGDVRAFFGSHSSACRKADELLFALGRQEVLDGAIRAAPFGKTLPTALYVHVDAMDQQPLALRLYEGCARAALGAVDGATIVKLRRDEPKVSYLCYPGFERDAHPELVESVSVHLQTFRTRTRRYDPAVNPPVLHRKETFLPAGAPNREKFERLTRAEERAGLLENGSTIGTRSGWCHELSSRGFEVRGHRLVRSSRERG